MRFTSLKADISRNDESVSNYKENKEFLDNLDNTSWHEKK